MDASTILAIILGIAIGVGGSFWYIKKKSKGLIQQAMDILNKNGGVIPSLPGIINTLKSEVIDQAKKEGDIPKEEPLKAPAPSPNDKVIEGIEDVKSEKEDVEVKKK